MSREPRASSGSASRFGKRVLIASSSEVYDHPEESALHEDARRIYGPTTARRWAYADTKAIDEFLALADEESLQCAIAPLQRRGASTRVAVRDGHPAFRGGGPRRRRRSLRDGAQTRLLPSRTRSARSTRSSPSRPRQGGIFNVGRRSASRIVDLATRVIEKTGSSSEIVFVPYEEVFERGIEEEMFHRAPSIDKIAAMSLGPSTWTGSSTT